MSSNEPVIVPFVAAGCEQACASSHARISLHDRFEGGLTSLLILACAGLVSAQFLGGDVTKSELEQLAEFRYALRKFLRFSEQVTQENGITTLQYQLLLQVKGFPGRSHASIRELAERLQSKHHGVVALVTRCEELGLVTRETSNSDRRVVEVHLTSEGNRLLVRLARLHRHELMHLSELFPRPGR